MVPQADALARDVRFNDDGPLKQLVLLIVILNYGASDGVYCVSWMS